MKFLAKLAAVVLVIGGVLFAVGHAMGGEVYSARYGGVLHPWREALSIGWSGIWDDHTDHWYGFGDSVRDAVDDAQNAANDALDDAQDALDDARSAIDHHPDDHDGHDWD